MEGCFPTEKKQQATILINNTTGERDAQCSSLFLLTYLIINWIILFSAALLFSLNFTGNELNIQGFRVYK